MGAASRYAELFAYDDDAGEFLLEDDTPASPNSGITGPSSAGASGHP